MMKGWHIINNIFHDEELLKKGLPRKTEKMTVLEVSDISGYDSPDDEIRLSLMEKSRINMLNGSSCRILGRVRFPFHWKMKWS